MFFILGLCVGLIATLFWLRPVSFINGYSSYRLYRADGRSLSFQIQGLRIHYNVVGPEEGPAIVLVHGLGGRAENWQFLSRHLVRAGYRVYMPDLAGFGRSEQPKDFSYSVTDQAALVAGFLDALGLQQVNLGGWSMGGWIAQIVASQHPGRIRKLILFDSAGLQGVPSWKPSLFTPTTLEELNQFQSMLTPRPPKVPDFLSRDFVRLSKRNGWVVKRALHSMRTVTAWSDDMLPQLKMPLLIIWGTQDKIIPPASGEAMHRLAPHSQLELFPGEGHLIVMQGARKIAPAVVNFLNS